jgi:hypothetical protein
MDKKIATKTQNADANNLGEESLASKTSDWIDLDAMDNHL